MNSYVMPGATRDNVDIIKKTLEDICYRIDNRLESNNMQKFHDELKSSLVFNKTCVDGILTGIGSLFMALNHSIYNVKYEHLRELSNQFITEEITNGRIRNDGGDDVHKINSMLFSTKDDFNITVPDDTHITRLMTDYIIDFKKHLAKHFNSRKAAYSFADKVADSELAKFPDPSRHGGDANQTPYINTEQWQKISSLSRELNINININMLVKQIDEDDYERFCYQLDYSSVVKAAVLNDLIKHAINNNFNDRFVNDIGILYKFSRSDLYYNLPDDPSKLIQYFNTIISSGYDIYGIVHIKTLQTLLYNNEQKTIDILYDKYRESDEKFNMDQLIEEKGKTLLHYCQTLDLFNDLIKKGCDINKPDVDGNTVLHSIVNQASIVSLKNNREQSDKSLFEKKDLLLRIIEDLDINSQNYLGHTPLDILLIHCKNDRDLKEQDQSKEEKINL